MSYPDFFDVDRYAAFLWAHELTSNKYGDWVVLDTETTGLSYNDEIVEISILNKKGAQLLDTLVRPSIPIANEAIKIHGITNEMILSAPTWEEIYPKIVSAIEGKNLVIYNAEFDLEKIKRMCDLYDLSVPKSKHVHCAMSWYAQYIGDYSEYWGNYKWQKLPSGSHRAARDALACWNLIREMAIPLHTPVKFVGDLFPKRQLALKWKPWKHVRIFDAANVQRYYGEPGTYIFDLNLPYIGWIESKMRCVRDG